ncbi:histidine kinase [uncultured Bacteroides sp.]|uniref:histidine kinase n=1 Tax=uncultured Bacteroides sp. TaxID=162156 RepID=UPI002AAABABA|nr:histidine kinase [uncultured Bacteroides sp.]
MNTKNRANITNIIGVFVILIFIPLCSCRKQTSAKIKNSQQIESFIQQAQDSSYTNVPLSRDLLKKAMKMAPDSLTFYRAYSSYTLTYSIINQYDSSYIFSHKILNYCKHQPLSPGIHELSASSNNTIGIYYQAMSQPDSAIIYFKEALKQYILANKKERIPDMYINLGDVFVRKGNYAMGAYYYRKALSKSNSLHLTDKMGFPIYSGLGQIYMELRDFELSDNYFRLAEKFFNSRTLVEKFIYCNNRGNHYYYKEEYAKALPWFKKAQSLVSKGDYQFYLNLCYLNLGDIFLNLNRQDSVSFYIDKSYAYFTTQQNKTALYYIATIKAGLALKQNNIPLAQEQLEATKDSTGIELNILSIRNKYLQKYYAQTKNFKQAYYYQSKNIAINDSVRSDKVDKRIAELDLRYKQDTTLINNKLVIQQQTSQMKYLKLISFIWILVSFIVIITSVFIYFYMKRKKNLQWAKYTDQVTKLRMENIRNRISPHFIFNVLNTEMNSLEENKRKNLYTLVKLMRKNLEITEHVNITLSEELDFVKSYIELEQRNLGEDFHLDWEIDNKISLDNTSIISMIIQIPVENAIKHALRPKQGNKILCILVTQTEDGINIFIRDNGTGYFPQQISQTKGTGTGLKVLYQTIQLLNIKNKSKILFSIQNIDKKEGLTGTEVKIHIPYDYKFE